MRTAHAVAARLHAYLRLGHRPLPFLRLVLMPCGRSRGPSAADELIAQAVPPGRTLAQLGELDPLVTAALIARAGHAEVWVDVERAEASDVERWHRDVIAAGLLPRLRVISGSHQLPMTETAEYAVVVGDARDGTALKGSLGNLRYRAGDGRIAVLEHRR